MFQRVGLQSENNVLDRMRYHFSGTKGVKMADLASLKPTSFRRMTCDVGGTKGPRMKLDQKRVSMGIGKVKRVNQTLIQILSLRLISKVVFYALAYSVDICSNVPSSLFHYRVKVDFIDALSLFNQSIKSYFVSSRRSGVTYTVIFSVVNKIPIMS